MSQTAPFRARAFQIFRRAAPRLFSGSRVSPGRRSELDLFFVGTNRKQIGHGAEVPGLSLGGGRGPVAGHWLQNIWGGGRPLPCRFHGLSLGIGFPGCQWTNSIDEMDRSCPFAPESTVTEYRGCIQLATVTPSEGAILRRRGSLRPRR
jgi:hypothetical protein